jgi:hypothetical protein
MNFWYYLQNPAAALKLIKRTRPAQTPGRPNFGVAITRNADETAPAKNWATIYQITNKFLNVLASREQNRENIHTIEYAA